MLGVTNWQVRDVPANHLLCERKCKRVYIRRAEPYFFEIGNIPREIGQLTQLDRLWLNQNQLTGAWLCIMHLVCERERIMHVYGVYVVLNLFFMK